MMMTTNDPANPAERPELGAVATSLAMTNARSPLARCKLLAAVLTDAGNWTAGGIAQACRLLDARFVIVAQRAELAGAGPTTHAEISAALAAHLGDVGDPRGIDLLEALHLLGAALVTRGGLSSRSSAAALMRADSLRFAWLDVLAAERRQL